MRILILEHEPDAPACLFARWASARGHELEIAAVPELTSWPDPGELGAVVTLGSDESVHASRHPWIASELAFLQAAHAHGTPILGICFGSQALAKALGGDVSSAARADVGWAEVASDAPDLVTQGPWFRWHADRSSLPPGAKLLAGTETQTYAFALGHSIGLQFHPEVDRGLAEQWITGGRAKLTAQGFDVSQLREEIARGARGAGARAFDLFDRIAAWWAERGADSDWPASQLPLR